jgi:hypothetical protein
MASKNLPVSNFFISVDTVESDPITRQTQFIPGLGFICIIRALRLAA